ncbi:LytR/AlgR family response regulator transcription factor [Acidobacteriota bacterium]
MTRLRVLIADDEELSRIRLRDLLAGMDDVMLCAEACDGAEAVALTKEHAPDLLLLDIHMPGLDGFQVVEELDDPPLFLFATAHDQYALKAFEIASVDYLLKPFGKKRLRQALDRAKERLAAGARPQIDLQSIIEKLKGPEETYRTRFTSQKKSKVVILEALEISHFLIEDTILFACRGAERFPLKGSLETLDKELDPDRFFRCHRSVIVNLDYIKEIRPLWKGNFIIEIKGKKNTTIPLSRRQAKILRERFPW